MGVPAIKLQGSKVLVLPKKQPEKKHGDIIIPVTAAAQLEEAEVVLIGDKVVNLSVGDIVMYPSGAGTQQDFDGTWYKILSGPTKEVEGDIWAIV